MYTYIIESQGYYKIGKTIHIKKAITNYARCNPKFELIHIINNDCVGYLHKKFESKKATGDWFHLSVLDIEWIKGNDVELLENVGMIKKRPAERSLSIIEKQEFDKVKKLRALGYEYDEEVRKVSLREMIVKKQVDIDKMKQFYSKK